VLEILRARDVEFDVIEYIEYPPGEAVLRRLLQQVGCAPAEFLHPGSVDKLGLKLEDYDTPDALVGLLLEHPGVMNRPVCVRGERAVIARPSEKVLEILD
jgi:arsenate reductase